MVGRAGNLHGRLQTEHTKGNGRIFGRGVGGGGGGGGGKGHRRPSAGGRVGGWAGGKNV